MRPPLAVALAALLLLEASDTQSIVVTRVFPQPEVVPYTVFMKYGSEHAVKEAGLLQIEGKEYVVSDGDIMHIRFNV